MDSDSNLEDELEEELLLDPEQIRPSLSTPRQRLEDARATARASIGRCSADDARGEANPYTALDVDTGWRHNCSLSTEEDSSMNLLLQRLSSDGAGNGERACFDEISTESQRTLAEMNETLGSLRRWRKQRDIDPRTTDPEGAPNNSTELSLLPDINPNPHWNRSSPETMTNRPRNDNNGKIASPSLHDVADDADSSCDEEARKHQVSGEEVVGGAQDPLVALWQEHHLRAQQAVGRLQEQLKHNIITYPASQPRDSSATIAVADVVGDGKTEANAAGKARKEAFPIQSLLASGGKCELPSKSSPSSSNGGGGERSSTKDRVSELRRDVDGLQMNQWIQHTRTKACDRAEALAREACDDIWRGTGSAAVGRMEGELDSFARDLDVLLLRLLGIDGGDDRGDEQGQEIYDVGSDVGDAIVVQQNHVEDEEERRAPVADAHVGHPAAAEPSEQQR